MPPVLQEDSRAQSLCSAEGSGCLRCLDLQGTGDDPHLPSIPSKTTLLQHLASPRGVWAPAGSKEDGKLD